MQTIAKPRIMHIISGRGAGGSKQVFLDYHFTLMKLGYDITACVRNGSFVYKQLEKRDCSLRVMNYSRFLLTKKSHAQLIKLYQTIAPHWLVVHNPKDAKLWRKLIPEAYILLVVHSNELTGVPHADSIITVNPTLQKEIREKSSKPCLLVPNGLLTQPLVQTEKDTNAPIVFGYLGKIRRSKGIILLLNALAKIPANAPAWSIIIQGEGHLKAFTQLWAIFKGISHRIEWRPWQDAQSFYKDIDILVVPSKKETFGLVVIEALMHGRKVLSTQTPGPRWILERLGLKTNSCAIDSQELAALLTQACHTEVISVSPEIVWEMFGEPSFRKSLEQAFIDLQSTN